MQPFPLESRADHVGGAALICCIAGKVEAKCLGGAERIHCHVGTAALAGTGSLPGLLHKAKFRSESDRSSAAGRADRFTAMLALLCWHWQAQRFSWVCSLYVALKSKWFNCKVALVVDKATLAMRRRSGKELFPYCRAVDVRWL